MAERTEFRIGASESEGVFQERKIRGIAIKLTDEQKEAIARFWKETGTVGNVELVTEVVNDRISPASIQVGTAK